jgi:hypothetical protein
VFINRKTAIQTDLLQIEPGPQPFWFLSAVDMGATTYLGGFEASSGLDQCWCGCGHGREYLASVHVGRPWAEYLLVIYHHQHYRVDFIREI